MKIQWSWEHMQRDILETHDNQKLRLIPWILKGTNEIFHKTMNRLLHSSHQMRVNKLSSSQV